MDVGVLAAPIPLREHQITLRSLWSRRLRRHLALVDAIGPVGEHLDRPAAAEAIQRAAHVRSALPRAHAHVPPFGSRMGVRNRFDEFPGRAIPHLMTQLAAVLHPADPVGLRAHVRRDAVAGRAGTREFALIGNLDHRVPVVGGIDRRGVLRCRGDDRLKIALLPRASGHRLGVGQAVAADPERVVAARQIRHHVAAGIVGDDDLAELGAQAGRFGDDPDAGLRSFRAGHDAADVVVVDGHRPGRLLSRHEPGKEKR